jgi:putative peptidoglycan lipid II flippase
MLSQIDARKELDRFKRTFSRGLRLVLVVIIPAAVGLLVLGKPIIALIFEHGEFTPEDTLQTWRALRYYLPGLPFAAIDLPLIFAFYAQKDTVTPVIVGIVGVVIYLLVGPALAFLAGWGFLGLVAANSVQLISHAVIMLVLFSRRFDGLWGYGVGRVTVKALVASLPVAFLGYGAYALLGRLAPAGLVGNIVIVGASAMLGALGYVLGARLLHIDELDSLWQLIRRRLRAPRGA